MSLRINQNIEALTANRYLAQNDAMLSKSIESIASFWAKYRLAACESIKILRR